MPIIANYAYEKNTIPKISQWIYGRNWPAVYIIYNDEMAYVGETLDLTRRTLQHLDEKKFDVFSNICLISDLSFNKSVILDLESFLIKHISADGTRKLINGNAGVTDHNYFYKNAYEEEFKDIWNSLLSRGIVSKTISSIENSELFKYSPYKVLNEEQEKTAIDILRELYKANSLGSKSLIEVRGGAGTGKTILAVYIIKLLNDISNNKDVWEYTDDDEATYAFRKLAGKIQGIRRIGFVVPMRTLRSAMKDIFKSVDGLSPDMVLAPEEAAVSQRFDLLVVDEAHRLYRRHHLPGQQLYGKFDKINDNILGPGNAKHDETDPTELDWIIGNSRLQVLFYDDLQTIRATDIGSDRFNRICTPHLIKYYTLFSQMRCKGGNGYYEYVKHILEEKDMSIKEYKNFDNYQTKVIDNITDLFDVITKNNEKYGLCKVLSGPGWKINEDIIIQGHKYHWASDKDKISDTGKIYSIHKCQGFDLNYAGVIFGREVFYDTDLKCICVNKEHLMDNFMKSSGEDAMKQYLLNIYLTLMTRGIRGTFIYAVDEALRDYLKMFFD